MRFPAVVVFAIFTGATCGCAITSPPRKRDCDCDLRHRAENTLRGQRCGHHSRRKREAILEQKKKQINTRLRNSSKIPQRLNKNLDKIKDLFQSKPNGRIYNKDCIKVTNPDPNPDPNPVTDPGCGFAELESQFRWLYEELQNIKARGIDVENCKKIAEGKYEGEKCDEFMNKFKAIKSILDLLKQKIKSINAQLLKIENLVEAKLRSKHFYGDTTTAEEAFRDQTANGSDEDGDQGINKWTWALEGLERAMRPMGLEDVPAANGADPTGGYKGELDGSRKDIATFSDDKKQILDDDMKNFSGIVDKLKVIKEIWKNVSGM